MKAMLLIKKMHKAQGATLVALAAMVGLAGTAGAATPDAFATVTQPIGVAATQSEVLVSQPFCVNDTQTGPLSPAQWQILKFDTAGNQTLFATLPANPDYGISGTKGILSNCEETYLAISTGLFGGFPSNHTYATQGGHIYDFDATGALVMHGASNSLAFIPSLEVPFAHTGLVFDTVGTFGNKLIVVGTDSSNFGEVWTVDSAGNTAKLLTFSGPGGTAVCNENAPAEIPCFESPDVAPLMGPIGGTFPGFLFAPAPGLSGHSPDVVAISPSLVLSQPNGAGEPSVAEAVHFVPSNPCSFNFTPNGASYEFFNASFANGGAGALGNTVYAYRSSAFGGLAGQLLVTGEGAGLSISTDAVIDYTLFDSTNYNSEGSNFVQCVAICPPCPAIKKCPKDDEGEGDDEHDSGNDKGSIKHISRAKKGPHHKSLWDNHNNNDENMNGDDNGNQQGDDDNGNCPGSESDDD